MTNPEFSNEFDVLFNNITSNQAPGLDEYEKSVFLTAGQSDILRSYFNARENKPQQGFDDSRKRQIDFSALMKSKTLDKKNLTLKFDNRSLSYRMPQDLFLFVNEACKDDSLRYVVIPISYEEYDRLMLKPYQYPIKRGVWRLIVDSSEPEKASMSFSNGKVLSIVNSSPKEVVFRMTKSARSFPLINGDEGMTSAPNIGAAPVIEETATTVTVTCELSTSLANTQQYFTTFLVLPGNSWYDKLKTYTGNFVLANGDTLFPVIDMEEIPAQGITLKADPATPVIELIGRFKESSLTYTVRYVRRPRPIILRDLGEGLSIQGESAESSCELDESLHQEILKRAVELAKAAYSGDLQSQIALGQASQTDIGAVAQSR